jgi:hypothetical protein
MLMWSLILFSAGILWWVWQSWKLYRERLYLVAFGLGTAAIGSAIALPALDWMLGPSYIVKDGWSKRTPAS